MRAGPAVPCLVLRGRHSTTVGRYDFTTEPAWPAELPAQLVSGLVSRWFMNGRWRELDGHGRQDEVLRVLQESRSIKILTASVYVRHRWKDLAVQTNSGARSAARVSSTPSGGAGRRNFGHSATARGGLRRMREWNRRAASAQANVLYFHMLYSRRHVVRFCSPHCAVPSHSLPRPKDADRRCGAGRG